MRTTKCRTRNRLRHTEKRGKTEIHTIVPGVRGEN